jgi:3-oxoadipate enol-lactonase
MRATVNGIDTFYEVHGAGEPLLFIHGGYGGVASSVGPTRPPEIVTILAESPVQVITYDRRSAGQSAYVLEPYSQDDIVEDARALLDHLGIERAIVCGQSAGGPLALHLAIAHPERVSALVLACTAPFLMRPRPRTELFRKLLDDAASRGDRAFFESRKDALRNPAPAKNLQHPSREEQEKKRDEAVRAALLDVPDEDLFRYSTGELRNLAAAFGSDCTPRIGEIDVPAIMVHGTIDSHVPFPWGQELHKALRNSEFHAIEGSDHGVMSWPEAGKLVRAWVERRLAAATV